jgi:hypothetical protein
VFIHPLTNLPPSASDIETSFYYPKYSLNKMPIGEIVTILCHFSNDNEIPFNVTAIMGSLNSPFDFNFYIQNYTYKPLGIIVQPGTEVTFEYQFQVRDFFFCDEISSFF